MRRTIVVMALWAAAVGIGVAPASAASLWVSPTGTDTSDCVWPSSEPCATIQHAIDESAGGDSVTVAAGVYDESLTIDKRLRLESQHGVPTYWYEPETRVEGGSGTAITVGASNVGIKGFDVATTGTGPAILVSGTTADELEVQDNVISGGSAGLHLEAGGEADRIWGNVFEGAGDGVRLSGAEDTDLQIVGNEFTASLDEYAILADSAGALENFEMEENEFAAPARIAARVEEGQKGQDEESDISGNKFKSSEGPQLAVDAGEVRMFSNHFNGQGSAGCLQILGSQGGLVPSEDVLVSLGNEFRDCNPYGIELGPDVDHISIFDSEFPGSRDGVLASGASSWDVTGHVRIEDNRIVGTTHLGVENQASGSLDAERNWWGCNAGPGAQGCDAASAGVNAEDNILLVGLVGPRKKETGYYELPRGNSITLYPGEQAEVGAALMDNGDGIVLGASTKEVPVSFYSSLGTFAYPTSTFQNGSTIRVFTAGSTPGEGSIVVSFDNQHTLIPVTVCCKPPAPPRPPAPAIAVSRKQIMVRGHSVTIGKITCPTACQVTPSRGRVAVAGRRHVFSAAVTPRGALAAGAAAPIRVTLPAAALRALGKGRTARLRATVTATDNYGQATNQVISVPFR